MTHEPERPDSQRNEWFNTHTIRLIGCLETPYDDKHNTRIFRATFPRDGRTWTIALFRTQGQQAAIRIHGPAQSLIMNFPEDDTVDPRELVAWLGLDEIDPDLVTWQAITRNSPIQIARGAPVPIDIKRLN